MQALWEHLSIEFSLDCKFLQARAASRRVSGNRYSVNISVTTRIHEKMNEGISPDTKNMPGSPSSTGEVIRARVATCVVLVCHDFLLQIKQLKFGGLNDVVSQVRAEIQSCNFRWRQGGGRLRRTHN